jgi:hypothetical protein
MDASCVDLEQWYCSGLDMSSELFSCLFACNRADPELFCDDGSTIISESDRCDGYIDCRDLNDEAGCPPDTTLACDNGELIPATLECDGVQDCFDGSDEAGCPEVAEVVCR